MTTITRKQFVAEFGTGGINVNELSPEMKAKLTAKGISLDELRKIAGSDGRIEGGKEFGDLFDLVDKFDDNKAPDLMDTADRAGAPTASGELRDALKAEVELNRLRAFNKGVIHLGMRPGSVKEAEALEKAVPAKNGGVVRIEGFRAAGQVDYEGKRYDLTDGAGLQAFKNALVAGPDKMPEGKAQALADYLARQKPATRDELAQLGLNLFRAGEGKSPVSRLVLSGHGSPSGGVFGDSSSENFSLRDVKKLAEIFPKGAEKIEHVAIASCFGASSESFDMLRATFPNLKSAFAYNYFAPNADARSPADLKRWAQMTSGDPSQVDPKIEKTATWNIADSVQGLPPFKVEEMEKRQKEYEPAFTEYQSGKKDKKLAQHDPRLNEYYLRLADLLRNPGTSEQRKREVQLRLGEVFRLRHPELAH